MALVPIMMLSCVVSAQAIGDTVVPAAGGPGGSPFVERCPQRQYLTGFEIRGGALVDAIRPICVVAYGPAEPGPLEPYPTMVGGPGGTAVQLLCPREFPFVKTMAFSWKTRDPTVIQSLQLVCGTAVAGDVDESFPPGPGPGFFGSDYSSYVDPDNPAEADSSRTCGGPSDDFRAAAVGITGRSGEWLDALGIICEPGVEFTPKPVALGRTETSGSPALKTMGGESPVCARARDARTRNSPVASRLEAECGAAGGNFTDRPLTQSADGTSDRAVAAGLQAGTVVQSPASKYGSMHIRPGMHGVAPRAAMLAASPPSPGAQPSAESVRGFAPPVFADGAQLWACNGADDAACTGRDAGAAFCRLQGFSGALELRTDGTPDLTLQARRPGTPVRAFDGNACTTADCVAVSELHCAP